MSERYVYFIRPVGMEGPVKIGCSATPLDRLMAIATWSPLLLELAATVPGSYDLERNIHECLADLHSHREWFRADPRITAIIDKLSAGVAIHDAMDLTDRRSTLSKKAKYWKDHPEGRLRFSYAIRINWAERRARSPNDWPSAPQSISDIMGRWDNQTMPSADEFAQLDAFLAEPARFLRKAA
jgi:hypothetical protein